MDNYPALKSAADWCIKHSVQIPDDITAGLYQHGIDIKTPGYYARVMWQAVRELYAGDIEAYDFEEVMLRLISEQLRKAWNEGMRELNLDPQEDQTAEGEAYLQEIMSSELDYVGPLAEDIIAAAEKKESIEQFRTRVDLWVGRYEDTKNESILFYSEKNQRLRWVYGDTKHCGTCQALNGIVAFASEWETAGVQPQSPPNDLLECQGWHCQCTLEPTDDRRSPDALTRIMDAITAGNIGKSVKGGPGSGNFGHEGRPGEVGGSGPGGGASEGDGRTVTPKKYSESLTDSEKQAVHTWGASGAEIRAAQRGDYSKLNEEQRLTVARDLRNWDSALEKAPEYDGVVYRGLTGVPRETIEEWRKAGEITLLNDQSATYSAETGRSFSSSWVGGEVRWEIEQNSGKDLLGQTHVTMGGKEISESEVVLRMGTAYEIESVDYYVVGVRDEPFVMNRETWPDYFEGSGYSWDNLPPKDEFDIERTYGGYYVVKMKEKP